MATWFHFSKMALRKEVFLFLAPLFLQRRSTLARWSQLQRAARTEILRGSVLSNLDEMCEWAHAASRRSALHRGR